MNSIRFGASYALFYTLKGQNKITELKSVSVTEEQPPGGFPDRVNPYPITGDIVANETHLTFLTNVPPTQQSHNFRIVQQLVKKLETNKLVNEDTLKHVKRLWMNIFIHQNLDATVDGRY